VWGAAWLYKATGENGYLQYLIRNGNVLGGTRVTVNTFSWDNKYAGAQVLLAQVCNLPPNGNPALAIQFFTAGSKSAKILAVHFISAAVT